MTGEFVVRKKKKLPTRCALCGAGGLATRLRVDVGPMQIDWYQLPSGWWSWGDVGIAVNEGRARCHHCMIDRGNAAVRMINHGK